MGVISSRMGKGGALTFVLLLASLVEGGNGGDIMMGESSPMLQRLRAAAEATKGSISSDGGAGSREGSSAAGARRRLPAGAGTTASTECRICGGSCSRKETTRCPRCW